MAGHERGGTRRNGTAVLAGEGAKRDSLVLLITDVKALLDCGGLSRRVVGGELLFPVRLGFDI